jgi:hypothetical protein
MFATRIKSKIKVYKKILATVFADLNKCLDKRNNSTVESSAFKITGYRTTSVLQTNLDSFFKNDKISIILC